MLIKRVGPNTAMFISGVGYKEPRLVVGGAALYFPCFQTLDYLSLNIMTLDVLTPGVYTKYGVAVTVDSVAQVKFFNDATSLRRAAEQFLGKSHDQVSSIALETLQGHQRAIMGTLTVENINLDRLKFSEKVLEVACPDLAKMGMEIVSYAIQKVSDQEGYLDALGQTRTAQVKRDAEVGRAAAEKEMQVAQSRERVLIAQAKFSDQTVIAESQRNHEIKEAIFKTESETKRAEAELSYQLAAVRLKQDIRKEEIEIQVVERRKQIELQEQEAQRAELEQRSEVKVVADAESYRIQQIANANKNSSIAASEAHAEDLRLQGQARADVLKAEAEARATETKIIGEAEADAILAKGKAEAEAQELKLQAWKSAPKEALVEMVLQNLPDLAAAISEPLAKTSNITMVSSGGSEGIGASRLMKEVTDGMATLPPIVNSLTGIDVIEALKQKVTN